MKNMKSQDKLLRLVNNSLKAIDHSRFMNKYKRRFKHKRDRESIDRYNSYRRKMEEKLKKLKHRILEKNIIRGN